MNTSLPFRFIACKFCLVSRIPSIALNNHKEVVVSKDKEITIKVEPRTDCPFNEPLHYDKDGCPACLEQDWQDHWENIADSNPDDGSWVGR